MTAGSGEPAPPSGSAPRLSTDEAWRGGTTATCDCCEQPSQRTWCMVTRDGEPYAVFFASCYDHTHARESWIDVIFGSWQQNGDFTDHVTFGCRFGPVDDEGELAATIVDAAFVVPDSALFGEKLSRDRALGHPGLAAFWEVVDFVVETDPLVHEHHFGHEPATGPG